MRSAMDISVTTSVTLNLRHPLYEVLLFHAQVPAVPDYDVVVEFDTHYLAGVYELACNVDIVLAGCRVAAGVVMGHDDGSGAFLDCGLEHLTGVDNIGVQAAY